MGPRQKGKARPENRLRNLSPISCHFAKWIGDPSEFQFLGHAKSRLLNRRGIHWILNFWGMQTQGCETERGSIGFRTFGACKLKVAKLNGDPSDFDFWGMQTQGCCEIEGGPSDFDFWGAKQGCNLDINLLNKPECFYTHRMD